MTTRERALRFFKAAWPWLVGTAITVVIALQVPLDAFRTAINEGPHVTLFVVDFLITIGLLLTDSVATWVGLIAARVRLQPFTVFAVRGATYLLALLNYVAGQGGLGFYLTRVGVPTARAIGATLFLTGTTFATLLLLTTATWAIANEPTANHTMWWVLVGGCIGFALYLVVIALAPRVLVRRDLFAPLFEARISGHAIAIATRIPHVILIVLGHWFGMRAWGIPVPFEAAALNLPAVAIAAALPISPAGFGTSQAALVYLFAQFAQQPTADGRSASMLAFSIVHFVYCVIAQVIVGWACIPLAKRAVATASQSTVTT